MEIINIIESKNGILSNVTSFVIIPENKDTQVEKANELFKLLIRKIDVILSKDDLNDYVDDGYYSSQSGVEIILSWSNVVDSNGISISINS